MSLAYDERNQRSESLNEEVPAAELHRGPSSLSHDARACLELAAVPLSRMLRGDTNLDGWQALASALHAVRCAQTLLDDLEGRSADVPALASVQIAMQRCQTMFAPMLQDRVELRVENLDRVAMVALPQLQLERILVTLLDNAAASIRDEGSVVVHASNLPVLPGPLGMDHQVSSVQITVEDTGCGVGTYDIARAVWTSTSRSADLAAGGLAIALSIVRAAGGRMDFERASRGTRVRVYLPIAQ